MSFSNSEMLRLLQSFYNEFKSREKILFLFEFNCSIYEARNISLRLLKFNFLHLKLGMACRKKPFKL